MQNGMLPKRLADEPIILPGSPYWNVFRRFGKDELVALVLNLIGTIFVGFFSVFPLAVAFAGPIFEKIGFFPAHFKEAYGVYRTTPKKERRNFSHYFGKALKNGGKSLAEDVVFHDPIYVLIMFLGLTFYSGIPMWFFSVFSFIVAVFLVAGIEVTITEIQYLKFKRKLKKIGFKEEKYFEARFFISSKESPEKVARKLTMYFKLGNFQRLGYNDIYVENRLPEFLGRRAKIRLRKRTYGKKWMQTAQIVYTRASEISKGLEQYRYFPIRKDKFYFVFGDKMPEKIAEINDSKVREFLGKVEQENGGRKLNFIRNVAYSKDLMISTDHKSERKGFYLLEIKSRNNPKMLLTAMRYVMREFPVVQTTRGKYEIKEF